MDQYFWIGMLIESILAANISQIRYTQHHKGVNLYWYHNPL